MCNPRRIEVTATRQVAEAWEREVQRAASRSGTVTGEARIRMPLDASIGAAALVALERALDGGLAGWTRAGDGYRHDVDGGYVVYSLADRSLEIIATASDVVHGQGEVRARLSGRVEGEIVARGQGRYYDDGYGGRTEATAREEARRAAEAGVEAQLRARLDGETQAAERAAVGALQADAERAALADWEAHAAERREALSRQAAERLSVVGVQARRAFHGLLALAYRDALLALARRRGGQSIECTESGDTLEIEFMLPD
jgi:hypothetical protein